MKYVTYLSFFLFLKRKSLYIPTFRTPPPYKSLILTFSDWDAVRCGWHHCRQGIERDRTSTVLTIYFHHGVMPTDSYIPIIYRVTSL